MSDPVVRRYYLYRATLSVGFVSPVFTLFLLRSLSYAEVGTLSALFAALVVLGEVPTGYVGDRIGRRASMLASVVCSALSLAGFALAESFTWFVALYVLWAAAWTFRSGSADAWLYETLEERLAPEEFSRVRGRGGAVTHWISVGTMLVGAALYIVDPRAPFVAAAALNALGVAALLSLPAAGERDDLSAERIAVRDALSVVRRRFSAPPLRSFVAFAALFFGCVGAAGVYVQPMAIEALGSSAEAAAAGEVGPAGALGLGVLYAGFTAVSAVASDRAGTLDALLGPRRGVEVVALATAGFLVAPAFLPVFALPAFVAMRGSGAVLQPLVNQYLNDRAPNVGRATLLSVASMLYAIVRAPAAMGAGIVADATTATVAVATLGAALFACGTGVLALGRLGRAVGAESATSTRKRL